MRHREQPFGCVAIWTSSKSVELPIVQIAASLRSSQWRIGDSKWPKMTQNDPPSKKHKQKTANLRGLAVFCCLSVKLLTRDNSLAGAHAGARAAVDALIGIDYIDIALRDSLNGALANTGTASYASVGNFVSHSCNVLSVNVCVCYCKYNHLFDKIKSRVRN